MHPATLVTLNMRELDRLKVIQAVVDTGLKPGRAAEKLGVTVRQIERLVLRYRESGAAGAMYELNIDTFCANSSPAKGRVERAHLTLQDRLVKELRLRGISTIVEANAYAPSFIASYNARFAKPPRSDFDAHRPLRADENLDLLMTWRETRRVTKSLTVQYDRVMYLLDDTPENRKLIHRYIDVWEYPDGRIEIRADERVLPCRQYDRLAELDRGTVVEHKRLSHVLQVAQVIQAQRDNRRISGSPSRTNQGQPVRAKERTQATKKQREFTQDDINEVVVELAQRRQPKSPGKPGRRPAGAG